MENECTLHNAVVIAINVPKIIKRQQIFN